MNAAATAQPDGFTLQEAAERQREVSRSDFLHNSEQPEIQASSS